MSYNERICKTLKELRIGKQLKVHNLVDNIMSPSYYYKVEKGTTRITADLLFQLLDRMNVGFREFSIMFNQTYLNKVSLFESENRLKLLDQYNNREFYIDHLKLLSDLKSNTPSNEKVKEIEKIIKEFLFEKESYFNYEIATFINFLPILDLKIVVMLYKKIMEQHSVMHDLLDINKQIEIILNLIYYFFEKREFVLMEFCYDELTKVLKQHKEQVTIKNIAYCRFYEALFNSKKKL